MSAKPTDRDFDFETWFHKTCGPRTGHFRVENARIACRGDAKLAALLMDGNMAELELRARRTWDLLHDHCKQAWDTAKKRETKP